MKTPYNHADKALKKLNDSIEREFQNFSMTVGFDELNYPEVQKQVGALYTRIDSLVRREYRKLAKKVYEETEDEIGVQHTEFASGAFIVALLKSFHPVTKYVYSHEWIRKRDRLVESLMASNGNQEMRGVLQRALNLMTGMVRQYADNVTDEARKTVFRVAGIEDVTWITQRDRVVCAVCAERDGKQYKLSEVPEKHHKCRCYLIPARSAE